MASSFKIIRHQNNGNLYFKLKGDFDGSSAAELANTLGSYDDVYRHIIIDTAALKTIHPFGLEAFKRKYRYINSLDLIWTGKYAIELSSYDESIV